MERGRRKEREEEGENHLDHKTDRKKLRELQKCSNTHFFFLVHIHQIHNGIIYARIFWDAKFKSLYMVSKNYSSDSNIALKDKRSRIWIHAVLSKGWGNCSKRLRWEFVSK